MQCVFIVQKCEITLLCHQTTLSCILRINQGLNKIFDIGQIFACLHTNIRKYANANIRSSFNWKTTNIRSKKFFHRQQILFLQTYTQIYILFMKCFKQTSIEWIELRMLWNKVQSRQPDVKLMSNYIWIKVSFLYQVTLILIN